MKRKLFLAVIGAVVAAMFLASCSQSPEQNPVIQEKFQKLADLSEEVDQLRARMKDIQNDIDTIHQDLMTLKQMPKSAEVSGAELQGLKTQITQLNGEISGLQNELSKMKSAGAAATTVKKVEATPPAKTTAPAKQEEPAKKTGQYYTVQQGDSLKKIADKFSTTSDAIRKANSIPDGREPLSGQKIFIPAR